MVHNSDTDRKFWRRQSGSYLWKRTTFLFSLFGFAAVATPLVLLTAVAGNSSDSNTETIERANSNSLEPESALYSQALSDDVDTEIGQPQNEQVDESAVAKNNVQIELKHQSSSQSSNRNTLRVNGQNVPLQQDGHTEKTINTSNSEVTIEVDSESTNTGEKSGSSSSMHIDIQSDIGSSPP